MLMFLLYQLPDVFSLTLTLYIIAKQHVEHCYFFHTHNSSLGFQKEKNNVRVSLEERDKLLAVVVVNNAVKGALLFVMPT